MSEDEKKPTIECRLCRKKYAAEPFFHRGREIDEWAKICVHCRKIWELGKKKAVLNKTDGKLGYAFVKLVLKTDGRDGDPSKETEIKSADIIAAMGAVKLRGIALSDQASLLSGAISVGTAGGWDFGGNEPVQVPEARAKAMEKIITRFHTALAKVRIDGFNEGRNLIAGLADGSVKIESYTEQADNARAGKKPKGRFD